MLQCLAELRGDAEGDGFSLRGAGGIAPQGGGKGALFAVLGVDLLLLTGESVFFAAGHGVGCLV